MTDSNIIKQDPVVLGVTEGLVCLTKLLRHTTEKDYMSEYEAAVIAADGIRALTNILPNLNL